MCAGPRISTNSVRTPRPEHRASRVHRGVEVVLPTLAGVDLSSLGLPGDSALVDPLDCHEHAPSMRRSSFRMWAWAPVCIQHSRRAVLGGLTALKESESERARGGRAPEHFGMYACMYSTSHSSPAAVLNTCICTFWRAHSEYAEYVFCM